MSTILDQPMEWTEILSYAEHNGVPWNTAHDKVTKANLLPHWGETSVGCWELSEIKINKRLDDDMKEVMVKFFEEHDTNYIEIIQ